MKLEYAVGALYDVDREGKVRSRIEISAQLPTAGSLDPSAVVDRVIAERSGGGPTRMLFPAKGLSAKAREAMMDHTAQMFAFAPRLIADTLSLPDVPIKDGLRLELHPRFWLNSRGPRLTTGSRGSLALITALPKGRGFSTYADAVFISRGLYGPLIISRGQAAASFEARFITALLVEQAERYRREISRILLHDPT